MRTKPDRILLVSACLLLIVPFAVVAGSPPPSAGLQSTVRGDGTLAPFITPIATNPLPTATPALPSSFNCTVKVDGANVPGGTVVSAWIGGVSYDSAQVHIFATDTVYFLDVPADVGSTPGKEGGTNGETVSFRIGDREAVQHGTWQFGTYTELNLSNASAWVYLPTVIR